MEKTKAKQKKAERKVRRRVRTKKKVRMKIAKSKNNYWEEEEDYQENEAHEEDAETRNVQEEQ